MMESNGARQGRTPRDTYDQLSPRCGGARVDVKDESKNKFRKTECFVDGRSDRNVRTIKDRRNRDLIKEDLKYLPENEPLAYVSITCGNSGYSLGRFAQEIGEDTKREIFVVNIVPLGLSPEIIKMLKECSIVVEMDLTEKVPFNQMREIAIEEIKKKHGISMGYDNVKTVERVGLEHGYRDIVREIKAQGDPPTYILCPAGGGELLVAIAEAAKKDYPENTPKVLGVTGHDNILAHFEIMGEDGFIAIENSRDNPDDKLASGYSTLLGKIRGLQAEGIVEIIAVDPAQIAKAWNDILELGIDSEPSAAVAFAGAFAYKAKLKPSDNLVIINSGKGIFDEANAERFLEKNYKKDQIDWEGKNGVMRAIDRNDKEMVRLLMAEMYEVLGAMDVHVRDYERQEAEWERELSISTRDPLEGYGPFGPLFLYNGSDLDFEIHSEQLEHQDKNGESPLMQAARLGRWEIADELLDLLVRGSKTSKLSTYVKDPLRTNFALRDRKGRTILNYAILSRNYDFALRVMENANWEDVDSQDKGGFRILQYACILEGEKTEQIIRKLIEKGAHIGDLLDFDAYPPAMAAEWASIDIISLLVNKAEEEYNKKVADAERLRSAIRAGNAEEAAELARNGISLDHRISSLNERYLRISIGCWNEKVKRRIERLVEAGMPIDWPNEDSKPSIGYAIFCGKTDAVRFLFRNGAKHPEFNEEEAVKRSEEVRRALSVRAEDEKDAAIRADALEGMFSKTDIAEFIESQRKPDDISK